MLNLALAEGCKPEGFGALYDTAVALDPNYLEAHFARANFYSKMWYGTKELQGAAIDRAVV